MFRRGEPNRDKAAKELAQALDRYAAEVAWRAKAKAQLTAGLEAYDNAIKHTIGLRLQERLTGDQADEIAGCQSVHKDISLSF